MRAKEFLAEAEGSRNVTINIPISITIPNGGGDPVVKAADQSLEEDLPPIPVWVNPLQQQLELQKQAGGKSSKVINQIISDDGAYGQFSDNIAEGDALDVNEHFEQLTATYEQITESRKR